MMRALFRLLPPARVAPGPAAIQRDTLGFVLDDGTRIEVLRVRDPRARRIKLSVDERGARLTLPPRASLVAGDRFLHAHRAWLGAQCAAHALQAGPALERGVTALLPLRDRDVPVAWQVGRASRVEADAEGGVVFSAPAAAGSAALQRALRDFYEAQARADVGRWLPGYLPGLPRAPRRILFKRTTSQWGSLAPDGSLSLDLALVLARPTAFEYVLVHELCHLLHADHSPRYWRAVEARFPEWRAERAWLRAHGRGLKGRLRVLLSA